MKLAPIPVEPIGSHKSMAFVDGHDAKGQPFGGLREVTVEDYPEEHVKRGALFRVARQAAGLSLGEAARALGVGVVELSGLERGSVTLSEEDWGAAVTAMARTETTR